MDPTSDGEPRLPGDALRIPTHARVQICAVERTASGRLTFTAVGEPVTEWEMNRERLERFLSETTGGPAKTYTVLPLFMVPARDG